MKLKTSLMGLLVGVSLAFVSFSCGSSGGSCGNTQPCGGDPTGTWKFTAACSTNAATFRSANCPEATASISGFTASGMASFNADKTYSLSFTESGTVSSNVPASCLQGLTCAQLSVLLTAEVAQPGSPFSTVSCSGSGSCVCKMTFSSMPMISSGTWMNDGTTTLALVSTVGTEDGGPYCVQGNQIHLISLDQTMPMGPMGMATITTDIIGTKQ